MGQVRATDVSEFNMFEIVPDALIGVEVWSIAWQTFEPDSLASALGEEGLDGLAAMDGSAIPDDQQLARNLLEQLLQKGDDSGAIKGFGLHGQVELTGRGDGADDRIVIIRELAAQNRRLPLWRPGAHDAGQQIEGGLINEKDRAPFFYCSFFSSGHVTSTHCSMAASLRWVARTTGRCALHPSCRSKGPM